MLAKISRCYDLTDDFFRLSIGIEDSQDLITDLTFALEV
ncbi:PLP-dependent transferase [Streptococcus constellatus]|nr:PLP-dependent transferase [Streptococcus constellatus]UTX65570.1 hypothetical protein DEH83_01825 [Streptococcus constellatus]